VQNGNFMVPILGPIRSNSSWFLLSPNIFVLAEIWNIPQFCPHLSPFCLSIHNYELTDVLFLNILTSFTLLTNLSVFSFFLHNRYHSTSRKISISELIPCIKWIYLCLFLFVSLLTLLQKCNSNKRKTDSSVILISSTKLWFKKSVPHFRKMMF
jgi:hypothetical protein